jgi:hypothetical protein
LWSRVSCFNIGTRCYLPPKYLDGSEPRHDDVAMGSTFKRANNLARQREETSRRNGKSFKAVVNATVCQRLEQVGKPTPPGARSVPPRAYSFRTVGHRRKLEVEAFERELTVRSATQRSCLWVTPAVTRVES